MIMAQTRTIASILRIAEADPDFRYQVMGHLSAILTEVQAKEILALATVKVK